MHHTLVTFLGRVPADRDRGTYRTVSYRCPDGELRTESFSGLALEESTAPDRVVVLGTSGSMWHVLLELTERYEQIPELWERLEQAHAADEVDEGDLARLGEELSAARGVPWQARRIPYGRDAAGQAGILRILAGEVPHGGRVTMDVTHGLRHLPMVALVSALQLRTLRDATVDGLYYGALDMAADGEAPVVNLDGLLAATDWLEALHTYDKDGDYAAFAELYRREGVGDQEAGRLEEAAFHERTTNPVLARQDLLTFQKAAPSLDTPIGGLFAEDLWQRVQWHRRPRRSEWEQNLAHQYLGRRDYLRAALFAHEAYISRRVEQRGGDITDHNVRDEAKQGINSRNFKRLKDLRNAMAHGDRPKTEEGREALASEDALHDHLNHLIDSLLSDDNPGWRGH